MSQGTVWSLILAAGEGTRLGSLTTNAGLRVPKQFCSLRGGAPLLAQALDRGGAVASRQRTTAVVARQHRSWWETPLESLASENVIVQPENKGTAVGLLLPLLHIATRDPLATILVLPSDHFVLDEPGLARALERAIRLADADRRHVYLLGLAPRDVDPDLGYIVPAMREILDVAPVRRFVEKPAMDAARALISEGAMINMFIIAASARALLRLYAARYPQLLARMAAAVEFDRWNAKEAVAAQQLYPELPSMDFSRDVLEGQEPWLRVLTVPDCGWSDLGTPGRVGEILARIGARPAGESDGTPCLNLAEQYARFGTIRRTARGL